MATAMTLTPRPGLAAVLIEITGAPAGALTVTRTDASGVAAVRLLPGQVPSAGILTVVDYDPALTGTLTYRAIDSAAGTVTATTTLHGLVLVPWVHDPLTPSARFDIPSSITNLSRSRRGGATLHTVIDRADPVALFAPTEYATGRLDLVAESWAAALDMEAVLARASVMLLRQPDYPGMDLYFVTTSTDIAPMDVASSTLRWVVQVGYAAVANPTDPLSGAAGWTWAEAETTYATWADVELANATWNDFLVGP